MLSSGLHCMPELNTCVTLDCPHPKKCSKTADHLAIQCDIMLYHDYTHKHNEVVRCIHLRFYLKYIIYMHYHACIHTLFKKYYLMRIARLV
ncbi:hypothetical protein PAEPH01_1953 [Pancytospora epiphaga]|nr:hypothetical protein PAEPH01_1953 [Pancytospora epiphaga]